jgi:pimeloyl-ACP methyl ester carboxylesterase
MNNILNERVRPRLAIILVASAFWSEMALRALADSTTFRGQKTAWHGFERYDFLMDEDGLTLKPIKAAPDERNGIKGHVKGQLRCVVVVPKQPAAGNPWSWRGCYWDHEPQTEVELLNRGFHIAFVMSDPGKPWDAWYRFLTEEHKFSRKPAFIGMSRGGVNEYAWATANPDKVACIYADNPALRTESLQKIGELATNDVPLLHICGSLDFLLQQHSLAVESVYHRLGGRITMMFKEGVPHHPHSLRDPRPIADWIVRNVGPTSDSPPAFAGKNFTKSYYYSIEDSFKHFPKENTYVICRGPLFTECYERYDVKTDSPWGITAMTVIVPKTAAHGKPWVFRADRIGRNTEVVDLALLARGFHIVAASVTAQSGPVREQWDAVYKRLTDDGFSSRPVMEGAGAAAGEAYAWAIDNPDKVSCIYGENPALRSLMSKQRLVDHLGVLAKAGVPLIHVCGSLDPYLNDQTRVVERQYKEMGGKITVIIKEGEGHFPLAPKDPKAIADLIVGCVR